MKSVLKHCTAVGRGNVERAKFSTLKTGVVILSLLKVQWISLPQLTTIQQPFFFCKIKKACIKKVNVNDYMNEKVNE